MNELNTRLVFVKFKLTIYRNGVCHRHNKVAQRALVVGNEVGFVMTAAGLSLVIDGFVASLLLVLGRVKFFLKFCMQRSMNGIKLNGPRQVNQHHKHHKTAGDGCSELFYALCVTLTAHACA